MYGPEPGPTQEPARGHAHAAVLEPLPDEHEPQPPVEAAAQRALDRDLDVALLPVCVCESVPWSWASNRSGIAGELIGVCPVPPAERSEKRRRGAGPGGPAALQGAGVHPAEERERQREHAERAAEPPAAPVALDPAEDAPEHRDEDDADAAER